MDFFDLIVQKRVVSQMAYVSPVVKVIELSLGQSFLQSNLEPIGGGDDPDIDW